MTSAIKSILLLGAGVCALAIAEGTATSFVSLGILNGPDRTPAYTQRDGYRHPAATLEFFDVQPDMTVVEIWPGAGWYTEILAPHVNRGKLYAAHFEADSDVKYLRDSRLFFTEKLKAYPDVYAAVELGEFSPNKNQLTVPDGSADRVLTFRNVHNWLRTKNEAEAFALFYRALKPGGILGLVEHRAIVPA